MLLASLAGPAAAQEAAPESAPAEAAAPAQPEAYPLAEVTVAAEETRKELKASEQALAVPAQVETIGKEVGPRAAAVRDAQRSTTRDLEREQPDPKGLDDLEREWLARQNEVKLWRDAVNRYSAVTDREIARLDGLSKRWKATRTAASEAGSDVTVERVDGILAEIARVEKLARERVKTLLGTQESIATLDRNIAESLAAVRQARAARRQRVFEPDSLPLWTLAVTATPAQSWATVVERRERDWEALRTYAGRHVERFAAHLALILATLVATIALKRRARRWAAEEPELAETAQALGDPLSVALLVGVATSRGFYPLAPTVLVELIGIVLIVPALRLLPRLVEPALRPMIYGLALLFLASHVRSLADGAPLLARSLLALEIAATIALFGWLLRPARLTRIRELEWLPSWLGGVMRIAMALLVVAFVANVTGYRAFAVVTAEGTFSSVYGAVILYGLYRVVRAFLAIALRTPTARRLGMVRTGQAAIQARLSSLLRLLAVLWWAEITLRNFDVADPAYELLRDFVTSPVTLGSVSISLGDVLLFAGVVYVTWLLSRFTRFFLEEDVYPRVVLRRGVSNAITTTIHYAILIAGFLFAVAAAGMDLSRVTLLAGAFGVGIGFGLQNVVNNFVSGMILLFERPIQVGDTIEVGGLLGEVRRIGPRSSTVRTFDGAEVIVPNGMLISDQVINWTLSDRRRRITVGVGVKYGTAPERVLEILRAVAAENETVLAEPAPLGIFLGFGDSSLDFELRCWIPRYEEGFTMKTQLLTAINAKLAEAGIEIPFPQRDLHLRTVDEPARRALGEVAQAGELAEKPRPAWPRAAVPGSSPDEPGDRGPGGA